MKIKINMTANLKSKLDVLSSEYNVEFAGYLIGEVRNNEIFLDDLLLPPSQSVSAGGVEISGANQVELFKKYGDKKCCRILGHWHSHHTMGCFWSPTDKIDMSNMMEHKKFYIFMVSSMGKHLIKIFITEPIKFEIEGDDLELHLKTVSLDQMRYSVNKIIAANNTTKAQEQEAASTGNEQCIPENAEEEISSEDCENSSLGSYLG